MLRILTGPEEVERRIERILVVPPEGDSIEDSMEFLTANPTL